jgi:hypothetical protein
MRSSKYFITTFFDGLDSTSAAMDSEAEARAAFNLSALEGRPSFFFSDGTVGVGPDDFAEGGENAG